MRGLQIRLRARRTVATAALLVLAACGSTGREQRTMPGPDPVSEMFASPHAVAPTTTTSEPATTTTAAPALERSGGGSADVRAVQMRLAELGYDVGVADGGLGERTAHALMSFQKVEGLSRTGRVNEATTQALASASPPRPLVPGGQATRVEIDLDRQVLFFW